MLKQDETFAPRKTELSFGQRCKLWLIAWAIALVATAIPYPGMAVWVWLFPWGLMKIVGWKWSGYDYEHIVGWLPYLVLSVALLLVRKRSIYFVIYAILCVTLLLNVVGCHLMIQGMKDM